MEALRVSAVQQVVQHQRLQKGIAETTLVVNAPRLKRESVPSGEMQRGGRTANAATAGHPLNLGKGPKAKAYQMKIEVYCVRWLATGV